MRSWQFQQAKWSLSFHESIFFSPSWFSHLLQLCVKGHALAPCKQVHQQVIQHGLQTDPYLITKLCQVYADMGDLMNCKQLFKDLKQPNVFAWTALLGYYSSNGMTKDCIETYCEMRTSGVPSDNYVFPKVLRSCAQLQCLETGSAMHKDVFAYGSNCNRQVGNSLIDMYAKCRDIGSARRVFNEMEKRDLLSWNSFISGCVLNDLLCEAVELLPHMRLDVVKPDIVTWNTVMDAYCRMGRCEDARIIMKQIAEPNIISWTTLVSGYLRIGEHKAALDAFRSMTCDVKVHPDISSLSNILTACRHMGALFNGKETHCYGIKKFSSISFYDTAGAALLALYAKCRCIDEARIVFGFMDKHDVVTWNAMILGYSELSLGHLAMECFTDMQRMGISCDQITLSILLPSCDLRSGQGIHGFVLKNSSLSTVLVWNALMNMYSKCGFIKCAHLVFTQMVTKDLISWNTMMGAFARHGLGQGALELLQDMFASDVCPNSVTLTSTLSACSHSGLVQEGIELFHRMPTFGISPSMEHFACVVDILSRAGLLDDAVDFIRQMPLKPDKRVWGAVLASCLAYQRLDIACVAAEQLVCLEPHHTGHYITLANLYTRTGRWDDAVRVRICMEGRELEKPSGFSLLEYEDNKGMVVSPSNPACYRINEKDEADS